MTAKVFISQSDRFNKNHGQVFRSSGIFYYANSPTRRTTITLWNHFKHKNNLDAALLASVRDMSGKLVHRERIGFTKGQVINYAPAFEEPFEGSVEIEAFAAENLKIPFTAIAALYESPASACLLHAYGRVYSSHEIEEARMVPIGREAGWTLRDAPGIRSFAVFHNGASIQPPQQAHLHIRNAAGAQRDVTIALDALPAFATVRLFPDEHVPDLAQFLGGKEGSASLDFQVNGAFTRMMVGNETATEIQVTHSNFNYSEHVSENLPAALKEAYLLVPGLGGRKKRVIVYPEFSPGHYAMTDGRRKFSFKPGDILVEPVDAGILAFTRDDGVLPARIVTGLAIDTPGLDLPAEISLNVFHGNKPDKRLSWGVCAADDRLRMSLVATDFAPVKGAFPASETLEVRVYSAVNHDYLSATLTAADMPRLGEGIAFSDLIPGLQAHLGGETGYFTVYSNYGGLFCYTLIESANGGVCLEHSF